jgi:hypothetical protein
MLLRSARDLKNVYLQRMGDSVQVTRIELPPGYGYIAVMQNCGVHRTARADDDRRLSQDAHADIGWYNIRKGQVTFFLIRHSLNGWGQEVLAMKLKVSQAVDMLQVTPIGRQFEVPAPCTSGK